MTMPYQSRRDPTPWSHGGEIALAAVAAAVLAIVLAALTGLALAAACFGSGWVWPHGTDTIVRVIGSLLAGHPGHGLPAGDTARLPGPGVIYGCIAVSEALLIGVIVAVALASSHWFRPGGARRGMASRWQAQQVLGRSRLREAARLIRPDLRRTKTIKGHAS